MNNKVSKPQKKLLIIEDEGMDNILDETLIETGYSVRVIPLDSNAVNSIETLSPDFLIININKSIVYGVMLLCRIKQTYPELPAIVYVEHNLFDNDFLKFADKCIFRPNIPELDNSKNAISKVKRTVEALLNK